MRPTFFKSAAELRSWLARHRATATEVWVGFYKKASGKRGITYNEALCFGWIDGVRKSVDATSYTNRFSPRTTKSIWSAINIRKVAEAAAWRFFDSQSPSYKRTLTFWVMSAKKQETRLRRLDALIAESASGRRVGLLAPSKRRKAR